MLKLSDSDRRQLVLLFTPSWQSGLVCILAGLVVSVGVVVAFAVYNSPIQQQLLLWQQTAPPTATMPSQAPAGSVKPTLSNSWPLFIIWSLTGLVVYFLVTAVVRSLSRAEELRESLDDVNAQPRVLLATTAEHLLMRIVATAILVGMVNLFLKQLLPYAVTAAHASAADVWSPNGILYALLSFIMVALSLHVQVIFLRLAMGRLRVFSSV